MSAAYGQLINTSGDGQLAGHRRVRGSHGRDERGVRRHGLHPAGREGPRHRRRRPRETLATVSIPEDYSLYGYPANLGGHRRSRPTSSTTPPRPASSGTWRWPPSPSSSPWSVTWLVSRSITQPLRSLTRQAKEMAEHRLPDAVLDILETPLGDNVEVPEIEPVTGPHPRRGGRRGRRPQHGAGLGARPRRRAGRAPPQHRRLLRQPRPTQPEPAGPPARLHHRARVQRDRPRHPRPRCSGSTTWPPACAATPSRCSCSPASTRPASGPPRSAHRRHPRRPRRGRGLPAGHGPRRRARHDPRLGGRRPRPPPGRVHRERPHVLAARPERRHPRPQPPGRLHAGRSSTTGLGMPAADLAQANRRLAGTESFTIAPSKYLGHYVAGNLAARHGIHLQLENSPGNGITATIDLPPTLLTNEAPTGDPITDPHGTRAVATPVPPAPRPAPWRRVALGGRRTGGRRCPPAGARRARARAPRRRPSRPPAAWSSGRPRNTDAPAAHMPDDDLLATLSSYTRQRARATRCRAPGPSRRLPRCRRPCSRSRPPAGRWAASPAPGCPASAPPPPPRRQPAAGARVPASRRPGRSGQAPRGPVPGGPVPRPRRPWWPRPRCPRPVAWWPRPRRAGAPGPVPVPRAASASRSPAARRPAARRPRPPGAPGPAGLRSLRPGDPGPGQAGPPPSPFPPTGPQPVVGAPGGPGGPAGGPAPCRPRGPVTCGRAWRRSPPAPSGPSVPGARLASRSRPPGPVPTPARGASPRVASPAA